MGGYEYYVQQLPGAPHPCYMRRAVGRPGAAPEVVLDLNELAAVHGEYVQVGQASGGLGAGLAAKGMLLCAAGPWHGKQASKQDRCEPRQPLPAAAVPTPLPYSPLPPLPRR